MSVLKKRLAPTRFGQLAVAATDRMNLLRTAMLEPEAAAIMASFVTTRKLRERLCAPNKIFVDVGAHIGSVIGGVLSRGEQDRVIAVEAIPEKVANLRARFPKVEFHECAVGPQTGNVQFTIDKANSGFSSLDPNISKRRWRFGAFEVITVPMKRLDEILPHDEIGVMKIDVEGAELGALMGADALVSASRPTIIFESGIHDMEGYPKEALFAWFREREYDVFAPGRVAHASAPMTLDVFLDAHQFPRATADFFAVAREHVDAVRAKAKAILKV